MVVSMRYFWALTIRLSSCGLAMCFATSSAKWHRYHMPSCSPCGSRFMTATSSGAGDVGAKKSRLLRVVKIRQRFRLDGHHGAIGEHGFDLAFRLVGPLADMTAEFLQHLERARLGGGGTRGTADLLIGVVGEAEHN